jgi:tetratricopeptide (TPR) repeat protein
MMKRPKRRKPPDAKFWKQLAGACDAELAKIDIALMNLACATGLPFAERVNVAEHLRTLNNWAKHVQAEIDRNAHRQKREGLPWSQWAAGMMVTVLQQDCGVRYNPQRIHDPDFRDSRDQFIHGMIVGDGGTCASMPVVYVAIGRRLGFPMKLVSAKAHLFARWDSPDARFNLEGAGMGFGIKPDEYYLTFPMPIHPHERGQYLNSFSPREELATFLAARGHCLHDNERFAEAAEAYRAAHNLAPQAPHYENFWLLAEACAGRPVNAFFAHEARKDLARIRISR